MARALIAIALVVAACGGNDSNECHSSTDCTRPKECAGPNAPHVCGIAPREQCADDAACPGQRCQAIEDGCSTDGVGSECRDTCGSCDAGFVCDAGACVAISCLDGYACPAYQRCAPAEIPPTAPIYDRHHGCMNIACTDDAGCDNGMSCVNAYCQESIGTCVVPMAVP